MKRRWLPGCTRLVLANLTLDLCLGPGLDVAALLSRHAAGGDVSNTCPGRPGSERRRTLSTGTGRTENGTVLSVQETALPAPTLDESRSLFTSPAPGNRTLERALESLKAAAGDGTTLCGPASANGY